LITDILKLNVYV